MRWFFLSAQQEQIPTSDSQLATLVQQGILRPQTLVWHEGQADWQSLGELKPDLFTTNPLLRSSAVVGNSAAASPLKITEGLVRNSGWILTCGILFQLLALLLLVTGGLSAVHSYKEWHQVAASLEGAKPSISIVQSVFSVACQILAAISLRWMGSHLIGATGKLRHGQSTGEFALTEIGLRRLGKFFVILVVSLLLALASWGIVVLWVGLKFS